MRLCSLSILLLVLACAPVHAQVEAPPAPAPAPGNSQSVTPKPGAPQAIALGDLAARADNDERFASALAIRATASAAMPALAKRLQAIEASVDGKVSRIDGRQLRTLPILRLESLDRHWRFDARQYARWKREYRLATGPTTADAADVSKRLADWQATRAALPPDTLPAALSNRIDGVSAELRTAEQALSAPLSVQVALGQRGNRLEGRIEAGQREVTDAIGDIDRRLLRIESQPLWRATAGGQDPNGLAAVQQGTELEMGFLRQYNAAGLPNQRALHVLQVLLLPLLLWLAWRRRRSPADAQDPGTRVLRRPLSCWILLSMLGVMVFEPDAPVLLQQFAMIAALVPMLRLLPPESRRLLGAWPYVAAMAYLVLRFSVFLLDNPLLYRLYGLALAIALVASILWLLWRSRQRSGAGNPAGHAAGRVRAIRFVAWSAIVLLAVAIVANVLGNASLAEMLVGGVVDSGYMAVLLFAAFNVFAALLRELFAHRSAARLHLVKVQKVSLLDLLLRLLALAAVAGWVVFTMQRLRLFRPVYGAVEAVLTHRFAYGEFALSLGDVLAFVLAVFISFWVARLVRVLLREEVLSRMSLPRGVGNSISSLAYYALLMAGLLAALSVAGFKLGQLTLLFGALGVGIGLGLQDVVRNFVSGLILMFERPLQPGDVVEVSGTSGRVREIGMRATTLRTFDGADVVVPNGMLLSEKLTNWTLRDQSRRIELDLGVAYGSDPALVASVLERIAREMPGIAGDPPPVVLFQGFGDSALNFSLRAWTQDFDHWVALRSQLVARVYEALTRAGIAIPFPQRDLNLRGVSEDMREALARPARPGPDPAGVAAPADRPLPDQDPDPRPQPER